MERWRSSAGGWDHRQCLPTLPFPTDVLSSSKLHGGGGMAASLLTPTPRPPPPALSGSSFFPNLPAFGIYDRSSAKWRKCGVLGGTLVVACSSSRAGTAGTFRRRDLVLSGVASSAILMFPSSATCATTALDEDVKTAVFTDDINAYSFLYPLVVPAKKLVFKWVESRKPERYSSAAPLSPDARQRIVSERVDFLNNVVISVSIGPPNSRFLTSTDKSTWDAKDVADSILSDRSTLRVTTSQRMAESSVLGVHSSKVGDETYWYYDYLIRKSPTNLVQEPNLFRHFVTAVAERDGYLYSLSASTLSKEWEFMGPLLEKTVDSFRLLPPTDNYVPPYKDPWRFW
ncbi:hypothetical protein Taro_029760 [Colocasia esculenta]|uniref:PsbP C-terminal domain-containing protein n=1 Tax=Colocasia esculenta TaxID=4460 RepID=A0A843VM73_COLES|nr:hypothetical protein [Colocasia esculenta]